MMMETMERSTFNTIYKYEFIDIPKDGGFYKHCGNCCHYGLNADNFWKWSELLFKTNI